jgi:hypothetical protein
LEHLRTLALVVEPKRKVHNQKRKNLNNNLRMNPQDLRNRFLVNNQLQKAKKANNNKNLKKQNRKMEIKQKDKQLKNLRKRIKKPKITMVLRQKAKKVNRNNNPKKLKRKMHSKQKVR